MELWISSEADASVLSEEKLDQLRVSRNFVMDTINKVILDKTYKIPLINWDCIIVMMDEDGFDERIYYSVKKQDMDFRLKIDYVAFNNSDEAGRRSLIFEMLLRSLDLLEEKFKKARPKIEQVAYDELEKLKNDVRKIGFDNAWLKEF